MKRLRLFQSYDARKVFKNACNRYDLVYFGQVSQNVDEYKMVRGFTLSPSHVDRHYCVGTVADKDVVLLERSDTISSPSKPSQHCTWIILKIDLLGKSPCHIVLNGHAYDAITYEYLEIKYRSHHHLDAYQLHGYDPEFMKQFRVYVPSHELDTLRYLISPETSAILGHHFGKLDFELVGDELIVYLPTLRPQLDDIELMLKGGLWLADIINNVIAPERSHTALQ